MTREEARQMLPIIQAFAEGKTVQVLYPFSEDGEWSDEYDPDFNPLNYKWRIKPESMYRPFKSKEECFEEMKKHESFG